MPVQLPIASPQVLISYAGHDAFPASLLQYAIETLLAGEGVVAWTFQRDQAGDEREIAQSLKQQVSAPRRRPSFCCRDLGRAGLDYPYWC